MALTPSTAMTPAEKRAQRDAAEKDVLLREVDEAVRQSDFEYFVATWGRKLVVGIVLLLAIFAGYLFWQSRQEDAREAEGETLISAVDQIDGGNIPAGYDKLATLAADKGDGASVAARMMRAGLAVQQNKTDEATKLFAALAADADAAPEMRDLARLREIALRFDQMDKAQAIAALKPLAVPGKPYFGSAGELLAHAYLATGKTSEAGALFAQIAKTDGVPETLRARTRQMAGLLGVDAIEDPARAAAAQPVGAPRP